MNSVTVNKVKNLKGIVKISGSKNAAIPILCTSLLASNRVILKNIPRISDVYKLIKILRYLNCNVKFKYDKVIIDNSSVEYKPLTIKECSEIRGSYYLIGVMLYLFNKCEIILPGGCKIGKRPIDAHIDAYKAMGYNVSYENDVLIINADNIPKVFNYKMTKSSVGASINTIIGSLRFNNAVLENLVLEPEALDLIEFLKVLGFKIDALENKCVIKGASLNNNKISYMIISDRMEAMTFIIMGLLCGDIKIKNANINHIRYPLDLLINAKYNIVKEKKYIRAIKSRGEAFSIKTNTYPFFPTDMQPLFGVLLALSRGMCIVEETIFENRLQIYKDINSSGGNINVIGNKAYITGVSELNPNNYTSLDLRHSAALLLLILKFGGTVENLSLLERGYEDFFFKLKLLGANFKLKLKKRL